MATGVGHLSCVLCNAATVLVKQCHLPCKRLSADACTLHHAAAMRPEPRQRCQAGQSFMSHESWTVRCTLFPHVRVLSAVFWRGKFLPVGVLLPPFMYISACNCGLPSLSPAELTCDIVGQHRPLPACMCMPTPLWLYNVQQTTTCRLQREMKWSTSDTTQISLWGSKPSTAHLCMVIVLVDVA